MNPRAQEASRHTHHVGRRILIMGDPASGKSTLARRLAAVLDLPVIDIDDLHFPNGRQLALEEVSARIEEVIATFAGGWVCDGGGPRGENPFAFHCDTLIRLKLSLHIVAWQAARRRARRLLGREVAPGPRETIGRSFGRSSFLYWTIVRRRGSERRMREIVAAGGHERRLVVLSSQREIEALLAELRAGRARDATSERAEGQVEGS